MTDTAAIRVVLVDDHVMVLESLERLLADEPDITVVAAAGSVAAGLAAVEAHVPDVVVIDYLLPDGTGTELCRVVNERWPPMATVMVTGSGRDEAIFDAQRTGCSAYLEKSAASSELARTIRVVHAGGRGLHDSRLDQVPHPRDVIAVYQPIVNLIDGSVVGYEALARWSHAELGLLGPASWLRFAERSGAIVDIDAAVRRHAFAQLAVWRALVPEHRSLFVSVNVSGRELVDEGIREGFTEILEASEINAGDVLLEITETYFAGDTGDVERRLAELKSMGFRIALDDFGTGYSSLDYLRRFPIDVIKLDKSFTDGIENDEPRTLRLVEAMGRLAADVGATTVAEGIERESQRDRLVELGWPLGQGFYYARPAAADQTDPHARLPNPGPKAADAKR